MPDSADIVHCVCGVCVCVLFTQKIAYMFIEIAWSLSVCG